MSKTETNYPKCHFCGQELAEANKITTRPSEKTVYICHDCTDIIAAIVHDFAIEVFTDISHIMNDPKETWKVRLEAWEDKEI